MARPLPHRHDQLSRALSQQWPCRELQIRQLAALLDPDIPSPPTLVLYGISATCKSTITRAVLDALQLPHAIIRCVECITARHLLTKILLETLQALHMEDEWERFGKGKCEHVSTLLILLTDIIKVWKERQGLQQQETRKGNDKVVLVLDGIDRQREASQMLLAALARLGEMIPSLSVILIMNTTPRPLFLQSAGVSHITFPPYTRKEAIGIITTSGAPPPAIEGIANGIDDAAYSSIYTQFVATVYDSLVGPTAGTIPSFRTICERLWPRFIKPMVSGEAPPIGGSGSWDFTRLLLRNRAMFKVQGESMLVHHIVIPPEEDKTAGNTNGIDYGDNNNIKKNKKEREKKQLPKLPSLPYFPTLVLTSAYVASHTPSRLDTIFFSKFSSSSLSARNKRSHHRRRLKLLSQAQFDDDNDGSTNARKAKRVKTKITKSMLSSAFETTSATMSANDGGGGGNSNALVGASSSSTLLTARPFTLERLMAIYHAIDPNPPANALHTSAMADSIYTELATLRRLRLVVPSGGGGAGVGGGGGTASSADAGEKWCINVSGDWIGELAKGVGVEVGEWLAGGLD